MFDADGTFEPPHMACLNEKIIISNLKIIHIYYLIYCYCYNIIHLYKANDIKSFQNIEEQSVNSLPVNFFFLIKLRVLSVLSSLM